jgi:hypothetical protein
MGWNYRSAPSRCGIPEAAAFGGGNSLGFKTTASGSERNEKVLPWEWDVFLCHNSMHENSPRNILEESREMIITSFRTTDRLLPP